MTVDHYPLSQEKKCIRGCETLADTFTKRIGNKKIRIKKNLSKRRDQINTIHSIAHGSWHMTLSTWHYPPQYKVGLEFNCNIVSSWLSWLKLQHPWPRSNIPYAALESKNEIHCLESISNALNKKPHLRQINPIYLSPL